MWGHSHMFPPLSVMEIVTITRLHLRNSIRLQLEAFYRRKWQFLAIALD